METRLRNKSRIALGMAFIALIFILETSVADRVDPNPASPYVWAVLATVAALALAAFFRYRRQAARAGAARAARNSSTPD
jgi:hypothetical protein